MRAAVRPCRGTAVTGGGRRGRVTHVGAAQEDGREGRGHREGHVINNIMDLNINEI